MLLHREASDADGAEIVMATAVAAAMMMMMVGVSADAVSLKRWRRRRRRTGSWSKKLQVDALKWTKVWNLFKTGSQTDTLIDRLIDSQRDRRAGQPGDALFFACRGKTVCGCDVQCLSVYTCALL